MSSLEKCIKTLHEEILKNRTEIRNCIEASETRLLLKIEELRSKVTKLEEENVSLKQEVENLNRVQRKKNIIIFGLNKKKEEIVANNLCKELNDLLEVELKESDLSDIYPLGKSENCPIKIEFISGTKKLQVLKNCNKLKGKKISIAHDLTIAQRNEYKILRKHLTLVKQDGTHREFYIKGNKLFVDGVAYGVDELEKSEETQTKPNSAPPTPMNLVPIVNNVLTEQTDSSTPKKNPASNRPINKIGKDKPRTRSDSTQHLQNL